MVNKPLQKDQSPAGITDDEVIKQTSPPLPVMPGGIDSNVFERFREKHKVGGSSNIGLPGPYQSPNPHRTNPVRTKTESMEQASFLNELEDTEQLRDTLSGQTKNSGLAEQEAPPVEQNLMNLEEGGSSKNSAMPQSNLPSIKEDMEDDMRDEEIDLEDMSEDDLKGFIEDVIKDMVSAGEIEPGDEFVEDEVDVEDVDVEVEIDEMAHKDDEVKEEKEEMDEGHSRVKGEYGVGNEDGDRDDSKIEKETERMRFKEAMEEIQSLKEELSEVNLLNAKLLYTNKIFKAKNLTESKKVKVLKAFDKAKDVRQAKTIYETLSDGLLDKSKSPVNESVKGSASKATGIEPKAQKQPIIESNDVYNRMRKLAGLI